MTVSRLRDIPGIGVDKVGDAADAAADPRLLRLENLDTDLRPPQVALEVTHAAIDRDDANSYLPFQGHPALREAACARVAAGTGHSYDPGTQCVGVAGGLNGILNVLLATVEPGQEVVICDPVYAGLVNRIRLAGGVPRFVSCTPGPDGWATDPGELAAAIGPRTAAVVLMSPVMPTGAVLGGEHFDAIADPVSRHRAWVIWDVAMERIRFDGQPLVHPGAHPGLADRTITVGSASKELRMIGWRVGWVTGPEEIMADIGLAGLTNVVCQVGISQQAVAAVIDALSSGAAIYAAGGYHVVLDGIIGPWFLNRLLARARNDQVDVHYVVLRPERTVAAQRILGRPEDELSGRHQAIAAERPDDPGPVAQMYREFSALGPYERHVVDSSAMSAEETAEIVRRLMRSRRKPVPHRVTARSRMRHSLSRQAWCCARWTGDYAAPPSAAGVTGADEREVSQGVQRLFLISPNEPGCYLTVTRNRGFRETP